MQDTNDDEELEESLRACRQAYRRSSQSGGGNGTAKLTNSYLGRCTSETSTGSVNLYLDP